MALSFTNATGNILNRLGKLGLTIKQFKIYQTAQYTNYTDTVLGVVAQLNAESDVQAIMGSSYISLLDNGASQNGSVMQNLAAAICNRMVFRDNPQLSQTLTSSNILVSLTEIIRQMGQQGATFLAMSITGTPIVVSGEPGPHFSGTGNGIITISVRRPLDGRVLENSFAEKILFTCTQDSYIGFAVAGNEGFSVTGTGNQNNLFSFDWPLGSNCSTNLQAIDGNSDNSSGNLLTNSGFEDWTAGAPDKWIIDSGASLISEETGNVYSGSSALKITGDGATTLQMRQQFNSSSGTGAILNALTQLSINLYLRADEAPISTGVLTIDLVDSGNNTIQDQAGVANTFDIDLTALNTIYTPSNNPFRIPIVMPSTYFLRVRTSTVIDAGKVAYIDTMGMGFMSQCYTSGPFVAVHAGSSNFVQGDYAYAQITNSRGVGGTLSTFMTLMAQLFSSEVYGNELLFPTSSAPSIVDTTYIS